MYCIENDNGLRWSNNYGWTDEPFETFINKEEWRLPDGGKWVSLCPPALTTVAVGWILTRHRNLMNIRKLLASELEKLQDAEISDDIVKWVAGAEGEVSVAVLRLEQMLTIVKEEE